MARYKFPFCVQTYQECIHVACIVQSLWSSNLIDGFSEGKLLSRRKVKFLQELEIKYIKHIYGKIYLGKNNKLYRERDKSEKIYNVARWLGRKNFDGAWDALKWRTFNNNGKTTQERKRWWFMETKHKDQLSLRRVVIRFRKGAERSMQANHLDIPGVPSGFAPQISSSLCLCSSLSLPPPSSLPSRRFPRRGAAERRRACSRIAAVFSPRISGSRFTRGPPKSPTVSIDPPPEAENGKSKRKRTMKLRNFPPENFRRDSDARNRTSNLSSPEMALFKIHITKFRE